MTGWHSNQKTSSRQEFMPEWNIGGVKQVVGTALMIVRVLSIFLLYITLYNFSGFPLNGPCTG